MTGIRHDGGEPDRFCRSCERHPRLEEHFDGTTETLVIVGKKRPVYTARSPSVGGAP